MSQVTLEQVKAEHARLAKLIAILEAPATTIYAIEETEIELAAGERYAGLLLGDDGRPSHHLILLPDEAAEITWQDAKTWAEKAGGELPTRREQSLLFANLKGEFQPAWYWSSQEHETDGSCAWIQNFSYGNQNSSHKSYEGRARAVRRFTA